MRLVTRKGKKTIVEQGNAYGISHKSIKVRNRMHRKNLATEKKQFGSRCAAVAFFFFSFSFFYLFCFFLFFFLGSFCRKKSGAAAYCARKEREDRVEASVR